MITGKYMKKVFFCLYIATLLSSPLLLEAALPPFYQSLNEYKALLNSEELAQKLGSAESLRNIERTESGFQIKTTRYILIVDVIHDPQEHPGPIPFHFNFHELREAY